MSIYKTEADLIIRALLLGILPVSCQVDAESDSLLQYMIAAHTFWSHNLCINCFIYSVEYLVFEELYLCLVALGCGN